MIFLMFDNSKSVYEAPGAGVWGGGGGGGVKLGAAVGAAAVDAG